MDRKSALIETHGEVIGAHLYELELQAQAKEHERVARLRAELAELTRRRDEERLAGEQRLMPFARAMDDARTRWEAATAAYERERRCGQGALVPLANRIAELTGELCRDPRQARVQQWLVAKPEDVPQPREDHLQ